MEHFASFSIVLAASAPPGDRSAVHSVRPLPRFVGLRVAFAGAFFAGQLALIATSGARPERAFGFQMFRESTTVHLALLREVDAPSGHGTLELRAYGGAWKARDDDGNLHRFEWRDRVRTPALSTFDVPFEASYGAEATVARLRAAVEDVALHLRGDTETRRLVVEVTVRKNGREPVVVRVSSAPRRLAGGL